jgi:hypothetical protein
VSLGPVQRLLTNPMAVALDQILADRGPQVLDQWITTQATLIDQVPPGGLEDAVAHHPLLRRVAGRTVSRALTHWSPEWAAALLDTMWSVAPSVAQTVAPPAYHDQLTQAIQAMCARLADPAVFPWFVRETGTLADRVRQALDTDDNVTASSYTGA